MFLYYITDRRQLSPDERESHELLLASIRRAAEAGVDAVQLREKDLSARELLDLARAAAEAVKTINSQREVKTALLINSRIDIALASGADGVHLRSSDISAADARAIMTGAGHRRAIIAVSCHSLLEVELAEGQGADFAVFGPIFEKAGADSPAQGLAALENVCQRRSASPAMPVLALGGVDLNKAAQCVAAGAAGIAGIRLFQRSLSFRAQRGIPLAPTEFGKH